MGVLFDLLEQPRWRATFLFLLCAAVLAWFDYGPMLGFAKAGKEGAAGFAVNAVVGALLSAGLVANLVALRLLPFRTQVGVVWVELLALFLLFFYSFDLDYQFMWDRVPQMIGTVPAPSGFIQGAALTLFLCFISIILATILALIAALARLSNSGPAFGIATFYISFFRGTPLLLQIMLLYLGLPQLGLVFDAITAGIIALVLCYGAYMAEIFRAGIQAVASGQREAARALGLRPSLVMRLVVLPQAIRMIIPPTGNQFIAMLKDSALVSVLGAAELMYMSRVLGRREFKYMEMLIEAALIYWFLSFVFELAQARLERHYGKELSLKGPGGPGPKTL